MMAQGSSVLRGLGFAALCLVCLAVPVVYVMRTQNAPTTLGPGPASLPPLTSIAGALAGSHRVLFRYTGLDDMYGRLFESDITDAPGVAPAPKATLLSCERVHFAAGRGICLSADRGLFTTYQALLCDAQFKVRHTLKLTGMPSRVRVSPDGRLAAYTVFESGHSYSTPGFSTRTSIVDLETGELVVPDLERFTVQRDGATIQAVDFNFWGVTFCSDSKRFYATLQTGGIVYLVEGELARRQARVLREGIECPSLSPDNTRIAYKKRTGGRLSPVKWRLSVLALATGEERELAEERSVDDQVEWLDDQSILYGLPESPERSMVIDTWVVPADGSGKPRLLLSKACSLVIVRGEQ